MFNSGDIHHSLDPVAFACDRLGLRPDPVQAAILRSTARRGLLCCTRQWGKSTITAAKALHTALFQPQATILIGSPSERQSAELLTKCANFLDVLELPRRGDGRNKISLLLHNRSRIIGLPHKEHTVRGLSAPALILLDEAAAAPDSLYHALTPMLATNNGALWMMSTPREKRGFFYNEWITLENGWEKYSVTAYDCPRIPKAYLEGEARRLPKAVFDQEFLCLLRSTHHSLFQDEDLQAALQLPPIAGTPARVYIGLDLGQRADHSALTVLYLLQIVTGRRDLATYEPEILHRLYVKRIEQIPLGTPYPDIARIVRAAIQHPDCEGRTTLIIDAGGPGLPFIDFLRANPINANLIKLIITGAGTPHYASGAYHVSRAQLLTNLSLLFENKVLHIPDYDLLLTELRAIQSDFTTQADHDDLVMSLAIAAWQARANWRSALVPRAA